LPLPREQPPHVVRIGWLTLTSPEPSPQFVQGLQERGYAEGQNLAMEARGAGGSVERLAPLAAELVGLPVAFIVPANSPLAPLAAKEATSTIPIVFVGGAVDPIEAGLVASYARPGGNVTGFLSTPPELPAKQLELLKGAVPAASRVALLE